MTDRTPASTWTIIGALVFGIVLLDGIPRLYDAYQYRQAMKEFNRQMVELHKPHADPFGWRAASRANIRRTGPTQAANVDAIALKPGERCISGQRFAVVDGELRDVGTC